MGSVIGELLPLAVGAVSPVPIIATILMLLAPKAGGTSACFLAGWVVGIAAAGSAAESSSQRSSQGPANRGLVSDVDELAGC
jgi:predicted histidine transporter YuiF (NhaC family)